MYIYSKWLMADVEPESIASFAKMWGVDVDDSTPQTVERGDGSLIRRLVEYTESSESEWDATPDFVGRWIVGLANIPAQDALGSRLLGVITPSAALSEHIAAELLDHVKSLRATCEPVTFLLKTLLGLTNDPNGAQVSSVRVNDDVTRVLVQSSDQKALRDTVGGLLGNTEGVTMRTDEGKVTITDQGAAVFSDSTSAIQILGLMEKIIEAHAIPIAEPSIVWA
jgi:hypothetical protein